MYTYVSDSLHTIFKLFLHDVLEPVKAYLLPNIHSSCSLSLFSGLRHTRNVKHRTNNDLEPKHKVHSFQWQFALTPVSKAIPALCKPQNTPTNTALKKLHNSPRDTHLKTPKQTGISYSLYPCQHLTFATLQANGCVIRGKKSKQPMDVSEFNCTSTFFKFPILLLMPLRNLWRLLELASVNHLRPNRNTWLGYHICCVFDSRRVAAFCIKQDLAVHTGFTNLSCQACAKAPFLWGRL